MSSYKGKTVRVNSEPTVIADKFSDLTKFNDYLDKIPQEHKDRIGDLRVEPQAIIIKNPSIGEMAFKITERTPNKITFSADGMLPLSIIANLDAVEGGSQTDVTAVLDIELPMMLRPLIGGKLQQVADMFGDIIGKLAGNMSDNV